MFIHFYSINLKNKILEITGYSEILEHYFDMKIKIISCEKAMNIVSTENETVVKGNDRFYLIETTLFFYKIYFSVVNCLICDLINKMSILQK